MEFLRIAEELIDEKGLFREESRIRHPVVELFRESKQAKLRLRQISLPLANPWVEELIRRTLLYPSGHKLEKRDISKAILIALMRPLRQTVGSCFATAPLIIVQKEQLLFLLEDLYNLMTRGFLKRVVEGEEYRVPISVKLGDIGNQSPLLKCYEFTVASFSDWKIDFYKWNMYRSLGLNHEEKGGIGDVLYQSVDERLKLTSEEINALVGDIHLANDQMRATEALLRNASSYDQIRRLKTEMQVKNHHLAMCEEIYHDKVAKAGKLTKLFKWMTEEFLRLFPHYFQEVYDPEMFEGNGEIYEDRPAGFRLLYKHGRADPTVWTMIYNEEEYKSALVDFFRRIEGILVSESDLIPNLIDQIIARIHDPIFLESAKKRMGEKTPWAYISGGNLESLVKCYFGYPGELTREDFRPESPMDLCVRLIELMKDLPHQKPMLMLNEVHAFVLLPELAEFKEAYEYSGNTYTYVRDEIIRKGKILPFADTNWDHDYFAFAVNSEGVLELCRYDGRRIAPLPESWKELFMKKKWSVFIKPGEYTH